MQRFSVDCVIQRDLAKLPANIHTVSRSGSSRSSDKRMGRRVKSFSVEISDSGSAMQLKILKMCCRHKSGTFDLGVACLYSAPYRRTDHPQSIRFDAARACRFCTLLLLRCAAANEPWSSLDRDKCERTRETLPLGRVLSGDTRIETQPNYSVMLFWVPLLPGELGICAKIYDGGTGWDVTNGDFKWSPILAEI